MKILQRLLFAAAVIAIVAACLDADATTSVKRSTAAKHQFQRENPCPSTGRPTGSCPGYVIDHVIPLCAGGPDKPSNMQWQTVEDAKAKDRIEVAKCRPPGPGYHRTQ
jgi:hypothetical protein